MHRFIFMILLGALFIVPYSTSVFAQQVSRDVLAHAAQIGKNCPQKWESQNCLKVISASNKTLAINYMKALESRNKKPAMEAVKQTCAAATAATEGEYPAYAMTSAFTECVNGLYDISQKTNILPDQSHYQLLVGSVLCLNKAPQCVALEKQMNAYAR